MNKLVSVIILTYNNLQYLEGAFKSVVEQNYENVEVIISDDCSTGISKEKIMGIISKYEASFDVIININEKNLGTVKNFNTAIKISKGDIIVPLSCDDTFIDRDVIKDIVSYFEKSECYVCTSLRKGEMSGRILPDIEDIDLLKKEDVSLLLLRLSVGNFICGATLYYKREVFDKYGFLMKNIC